MRVTVPSGRYTDHMIDTRSLLLDSAASIVAAHGVGRLTLEFVAREAGVSKGGLLYHFKSKRELIEALIVRQLDDFEALLDSAMEGKERGAGKRVEEYARLGMQRLSTPNYMAGMMAVLSSEPDLLNLVRLRLARWRNELIDDGAHPDTAALAQCAVDGWRLWRAFDLGLPAGDGSDLILRLIERTADP